MRQLTEADLCGLIEMQQAGAVRGLAAVFPQDAFPFPRDAITARWRDETADPDIGTYVAEDDAGNLLGFASVEGPELLHFGAPCAARVHPAVASAAW